MVEPYVCKSLLSRSYKSVIISKNYGSWSKISECMGKRCDFLGWSFNR